MKLASNSSYTILRNTVLSAIQTLSFIANSVSCFPASISSCFHKFCTYMSATFSLSWRSPVPRSNWPPFSVNCYSPTNLADPERVISVFKIHVETQSTEAIPEHLRNMDIRHRGALSCKSNSKLVSKIPKLKIVKHLKTIRRRWLLSDLYQNTIATVTKVPQLLTRQLIMSYEVSHFKQIYFNCYGVTASFSSCIELQVT
jgi:hypothetical protein